MNFYQILHPEMYLYNLTLKDPSFISHSITGSFSGERKHEILLVKGNSIIEILRPNVETGKLELLIRQETFCKIRSILPYRLTGTLKDYFIIGSDSGRILIMEYVKDSSKNSFERIHLETFGKSGTRRTVPGQYLACDPKGRAVMISALEKSKLVYILNSDSTGQLTISSPLEANKSKTITCSVVEVDVGFENPIFAALELDYSSCDDFTEDSSTSSSPIKQVTYYELDLGLNHVVRKWCHQVHSSANALIPLPGGSDGPSGVLVCCDNYVQWVHNLSSLPIIQVPIPKANCKDLSAERNILVVSYAVHRSKNAFFILILCEDGDLFKITFDYDSKQINRMNISYFDTVEGAHAISLTKNGFLFVSYFAGCNSLFQVQKLGEDEKFSFSSVECSANEQINSIGDYVPSSAFLFERHPSLTNIELIEKYESPFPISDFRLFNFDSQTDPLIYACTGTQSSSSLLSLQHGLSTTNFAESAIRNGCNGIWSLKSELSDSFHSILVLSFPVSTLILSIGESISELKSVHNFITAASTVSMFTMINGSYLQITQTTVRHLTSITEFIDWKIPNQCKQISHVTCNGFQLIVVLDSVEIVYFELDSLGNIPEAADRKTVPSLISCISIADLTESSKYSKFLAVGCEDQTVRLVSLQKGDSWLEMFSMHVFSSIPYSLCLAHFSCGSSFSLYIHVSLSDGEYSYANINVADGSFVEMKSKNISNEKFSLRSVGISSTKKGIALLASRPALVYIDENTNSPVIFPIILSFPIDAITEISCEGCADGYVGISEAQLRIFSIEFNDSSFSIVKQVPLLFTPKKFISPIDPYDYFAVIESDYLTKPEHFAESSTNMPNIPVETTNDPTIDNEKCHDPDEMQISSDDEMQISSDNEIEMQLEAEKSSVQSQTFIKRSCVGSWSSRISFFDPFSLLLRQDIRLGENYVPISGCFLRFSSFATESHFVIGAVQNFILNPKSFTKCALFTFKLSQESQNYEILHVTEVEDIPLGICNFQGMLLVGVGNILRMYDLGKRKLLRKCENRLIRGQIGNITTKGMRIIISDLQMGPLFFHYKVHENQFVLVADDPLPRHLTSTLHLDWDTVACADKFGNFFVNRLPDSLISILNSDPSCSCINEKSFLQAAPHKSSTINDFHIGEIVTRIEKGSIAFGGRECLVYTTILGRIGIFIPFERKSQFDLVQLLESALRSECGSLFGRESIAYRSSYSPVQNVIDGDLCEMFFSLPFHKKSALADSLGKSVGEISALLKGFRENFAF